MNIESFDTKTDLPVSIGPQHEVQNTPVQPSTIILVDDDEDDRQFAINAFKRSVMIDSVLALPSGTDLIEYMKKEGFYDHSVIRYSPLIIMLDLNMPSMSGFDILKEIKSDSFLKEIPVIVLSGLKDDDRIINSFKLGADGFLKKPLELKSIESFLPTAWQWPPKELW